MPSDSKAVPVAAGFKQVRLGEIVSRRAESGRAGLPTASVTMNHGLVARNANERRVTTTLLPSQHLLVRKGDIAYNMMRMWQGACGIAREDCLISPAYVVLRPHEGVCPDFVFHLFKSPEMIAQFHRHSRGLTDDRLRLYYDEFQQIEAVIPDGYAAQEAISKALDVLDSEAKLTEKLIDKLRLMRPGLLNDLFTRGLTAQGKLRDPDRNRELFEAASPARIPKGWKRTPLKSAGEWRSGGTPSKENPRFWGGTIPWVSAKDLKSFVLVDSQDHITEEAAGAGARLVPAGSLMILVRGMTLARSLPVGLTAVPMAFNQDVRAIVTYPSVSAKYLGHWLTAHEGRILRLTTETTHGTKRFDIADLHALQLPLPERPEQERIAETIEVYDARISAEEAYRDKLALQRRGMLQSFLTGRVRV